LRPAGRDPRRVRVIRFAPISKGGKVSLKSTMRFALRMTVAAVAAFLLGQVLQLPMHGLWAVLTAVIVTQASVGGSIGASLEYVLGTLAGGLYATLVTLLIPHTTPLATAGVLALCIAPLAYAAARASAFRVAPFTAVIVLLLAGQFGLGPLAAGATRLLEVVLGSAIAVSVSMLLFPERSYRRAKQAAVLALEQLGSAVPVLLSGFSAPLDGEEVQRLQDSLGAAVGSFDAVAGDVKHEQSVSFGSRPHLGPLSRTLLRLRHDLVIIGRAAARPLPQELLSKLATRISAVGSVVGDYLLASARALGSGQAPPGKSQVDDVMNAYGSAVTTLRAAGILNALSGDELEQLFTMSFALDELRNHLTDLERWVQEWRTG
jgi:hypothetical protein